MMGAAIVFVPVQPQVKMAAVLSSQQDQFTKLTKLYWTTTCPLTYFISNLLELISFDSVQRPSQIS
jgi:hypothetical protein